MTAREREAWDEGFAAGFDVGARAAQGQPVPHSENPYPEQPRHSAGACIFCGDYHPRDDFL